MIKYEGKRELYIVHTHPTSTNDVERRNRSIRRPCCHCSSTFLIFFCIHTWLELHFLVFCSINLCGLHSLFHPQVSTLNTFDIIRYKYETMRLCQICCCHCHCLLRCNSTAPHSMYICHFLMTSLFARRIRTSFTKSLLALFCSHTISCIVHQFSQFVLVCQRTNVTEYTTAAKFRCESWKWWKHRVHLRTSIIANTKNEKRGGKLQKVVNYKVVVETSSRGKNRHHLLLSVSTPLCSLNWICKWEEV